MIRAMQNESEVPILFAGARAHDPSQESSSAFSARAMRRSGWQQPPRHRSDPSHARSTQPAPKDSLDSLVETSRRTVEDAPPPPRRRRADSAGQQQQYAADAWGSGKATPGSFVHNLTGAQL
jgi:hypothetical protein